MSPLTPPIADIQTDIDLRRFGATSGLIVGVGASAVAPQASKTNRVPTAERMTLSGISARTRS
jgi:hypothetical protein